MFGKLSRTTVHSWKQISAVALVLILGLSSAVSYGAADSGEEMISTSLSRSFSFVLVLLGTLLAICMVIIYFSLRLRRVNTELQERNAQILRINEDLQNSNKVLEEQKEKLSRKYYESEKFYGMLVQSADDGISFYDSAWNLKYANSAFYTMVGMDAEKYNSGNPDDLIHQGDSDFTKKRVDSLTEKGFFESELRLLHADGHYLTLSTRSVVVRNDNGEVLGSLTISRDITKLRTALEELVRANSEAEASNRLKTSFLANISHEIRTPLNSVVGFSNLLLADDLTLDVRKEYVEHINYNSEKLLQIIGDIIDLSRLESSQIEISYEETSLNTLVDEITREARQVIKRCEKPIILNVKNNFRENGDLIFTDRVWLKRVLNHLMDNAIKFTLDGSVEFICSLDDGNIVFRIRDTGIGINKENLVRIFEEFRQEIDGHHRPFEGLGVGLTLAKEVVERMGGRIFVESEKGIGSEFGFSLPYRPAGSTRQNVIDYQNINTGVSGWKSKKCLLVDDNRDMLLYLGRILQDTGISILTARSGYEAIQLIKSTHDIDIVLLDMQMPEMNGIEVTKEIRKLKEQLPIVAQTAFIFEDDKDIILEAGCDACLIKPIRKDHLVSTMAGILNK